VIDHSFVELTAPTTPSHLHQIEHEKLLTCFSELWYDKDNGPNRSWKLKQLTLGGLDNEM